MIISIEELFKNIKEEKCLIDKGTNIFIMKTIYSTETIPFNHEIIKNHCGSNKLINRVSNELVFELSRDFADPIKDYFPYLFHSKIDENKFEIFFCFINVEAAGEKLIKSKNQKDEKK